MSRSWTPQQLEAIEADGTLTVLSAAAGSGKTTVLVEKALRILLDKENPTPADKLLIVTFSNASAREFRNRIEKGINKAIKENPSDSYIKSQKAALQKADISTIHSFCIKLVRENFEKLDIAPDFTICDEAKSLVIHSRAIDMAMEYGYTLPDFCKYVTLFGKSSQDKKIREFLKEMFYYFSALPFPEKKAEELCAMSESEDFENSAVYAYLCRDIEEQIGYAEYLVEREKHYLALGDVQEYAAAIAKNEHIVSAMSAALKAGNSAELCSIAGAKLHSLGRVKSKSDSSVSISELNKTFAKTLEDIAEDAAFLDRNLYLEQSAQTKHYIRAVTDVFLYYSAKLMEIKKREKTFEFSDFEHFAVQLLLNEDGTRTRLAKDLSEKYVKIMEDEFQDTSYVQDMIFNTIAKDKESNLFVVGDVKQSIYGFRKASPQILLEKRSRGYKDPENAKTIVLPNNFRSDVKVIKGVNLIFERIMTEGLGGVNYSDGEQLVPAPNAIDCGGVGTSIMISVNDEQKMVAERVHRMVTEGYMIDDGGTKREVRYDDFCVLLRNRKNFGKFVEAFRRYGIRTFVKDDQPLLQKEEIQSITALLRVINNPTQEVYLTAGMFGDIFDFTLDEILTMKLEDKTENLYRLVASLDNPKAVAFMEQLKDFAFAAKIYSPDKLIDYIVNATGYYTKLSFCEDGSEKRENIRRFISFAKKYIKDYQSTLGDFLRYLDLCLETGKSSDTMSFQPPNTVAIMTMHNSKGLEFPICFVSGLGTQFNRQDRTKRLLMDTELGIATYANEKFGYNRSTAGVQAIRKKLLRSLADDEMRLLYVALTRAKNNLFLTAEFTRLLTQNTIIKMYEKSGRELNEYALRKANTPMEWIIVASMVHPDLFRDFFDAHKEQAVKENKPKKSKKKSAEETAQQTQPADNTAAGTDTAKADEHNGEQQPADGNTAPQQSEEPSVEQRREGESDRFMTFEVMYGMDFWGETEKEETPQIKLDSEKAMKNLGYVYPHLARTKLPVKVSVGEVAKAAHTVTLKKPDFVKQQHFSAAQKGTQMHLFAQHSDILLARTNLQSEIERLAQRGTVDKKLLNVKQIETFVNSPVATVMLNADKLYKEKEFLVSANARKVLGDDALEGEEILVQGVIDCLAVKNGEAVVIDYKTDRVDSMAQLYERYSKQLEMYRFAAHSLYDFEKVKCIIYSFYLGEYMEF